MTITLATALALVGWLLAIVAGFGMGVECAGGELKKRKRAAFALVASPILVLAGVAFAWVAA